MASCGYLPGHDPSAADVISPSPSQWPAFSASSPQPLPSCVPGEGEVCLSSPAPIQPILGTPNSSGPTTPGQVGPAVPTLSIVCNILFTAPDVVLAVVVIDQNTGAYVVSAQVTAQMVGTDPQYPTPPATVFSGSSASVDANVMPGVPTYRFVIENFSVPPPTYNSAGQQVTSPYATYRCHATAAWSGASVSF